MFLGHTSLLSDVIGLKVAWGVLIILDQGIIIIVGRSVTCIINAVLFLVEVLIGGLLDYLGHWLNWECGCDFGWHRFHWCLRRRALHLAYVDLLLSKRTVHIIIVLSLG